MKVLRERKTALTVTIICIIMATLFGVHKSLNRISGEVERMFYDGVYQAEGGYRQASIDEQLTKIAASVLNTISITANYPELSEQTESLRKLRVGLLEEKGIKNKYKKYTDMGVVYKSLYAEAERAPLTERERTALEEYNRTYNGAETVINTNGYNEEVKRFRSGEMYSPLAGILKPLAIIREPETFSG